LKAAPNVYDLAKNANRSTKQLRRTYMLEENVRAWERECGSEQHGVYTKEP
jgi:hypothetical protein